MCQEGQRTESRPSSGDADDQDEERRRSEEKGEYDYLKLSHDYAWNWFQYHAGQRMNVFRFYFVVLAVLGAGYLKALDSSTPIAALIFAGISIALSFLFYRADVRSQDLIKISERYLKRSERDLSARIGRSEILLASTADEKDTEIARQYRCTGLFSFKEIIRAVYGIFLAASFFAAGFSVWSLSFTPTKQQPAQKHDTQFKKSP
jgi:hypothetical protein